MVQRFNFGLMNGAGTQFYAQNVTDYFFFTKSSIFQFYKWWPTRMMVTALHHGDVHLTIVLSRNPDKVVWKAWQNKHIPSLGYKLLENDLRSSST